MGAYTTSDKALHVSLGLAMRDYVCTTTHAITQHLLPKYAKMPCQDRLREIVQEFETLWGFPQVVGAVDGTHIPILKPTECPSDYYNRKGFYSILIQGVVDSQGCFIDVNIGRLARKSARCKSTSNSTFYREATSGNLLPDWKRVINHVDVPLLILGNPTYPLLPWLMKPFTDNSHVTAAE